MGLKISFLKVTSLIFAILLSISPILVEIPFATASFEITTDKDTYTPGDYMTLTGSGATPNSPITLQLYDPDNNRVKIDQVTAGADGTFTITNFYHFTSSSTPGTYTIKAYEATLKIWATATVTLTIPDTTPPTITDVSPGNTTITLGSTITITVTVTDDTGVESVTLYYKRAWEDDYTSTSMSSTGASNQYGYTFTNVMSPTTYYIQASDTLGNTATSDTYKIMVSSTLLASTDKEEYNPGDTVTVTGSGATAYAGITIRLYDPSDVVKVVAQTTSKSDGTFTLSNLYTFQSSDPLGTWRICVYESVLDQWSNTTVTLTLIDTTPPTIADVSPGNTTVLSGSSVTITATVTDNMEVSSVTLYYKVGGEVDYTGVAMTGTGTPNEYSYTFSSVTEDITYYITAMDNSSNTAQTATYTITVYMDTTPPTITSISPGNRSILPGSSVTIKVTVMDDVEVSEVNLHYKTVTSPTYTEVVMTEAEGVNRYSYTLTNITESIQYYISATDTSSNTATSPIHTISVIVDETPPTIAHISPGDTVLSPGASLTVTAVITDNIEISSVTLYYRGEGDVDYTGVAMMETRTPNQYSYTFPSVTGNTTYYIVAVDTSSNTATSPTYTLTIYVDNNPPIIVDVDPGNTFIRAGSSVTIKIRVVDDRAVDSVTLYYKGEDAYTGVAMTQMGLSNWYKYTLRYLTETVPYYIVAVDTSGNTVTSPIYTVIVHHIPHLPI